MPIRSARRRTPSPRNNAIWLDYDRDGRLDLFVGNMNMSLSWTPVGNRLLRGLGDGAFVDRADDAGPGVILPAWGGSLGGMAAGDFDDDGWPDLYLGVFQAASRLFLGDREGGIQEATSSAIGDSMADFAQGWVLRVCRNSSAEILAPHPVETMRTT